MRSLTSLYVTCFIFTAFSTSGVTSSSAFLTAMGNVTVTSSSIFQPWVPSRIIDQKARIDADGCKCCSATLPQLNPWFQIDFGKPYKVKRVYIKGRAEHEYDQHFQNLQIFLESIHDANRNADTTEIRPVYVVDYTVPVPKTTRYVSMWLLNENRHLTVCEVTVYGECNDGEFGGRCERRCYCQGDPCDKVTGLCLSGTCLPGYEGQHCHKVCQGGSYGPGCTEKCGHCYGNNNCDRATGKCAGRCAAGYQGDLCKTECKNRTHGLDCSQSCGFCLDDKPCNVSTGQCEDGCSAGYQPPMCTTSCPKYKYGVSCAKTCGYCKNNGTCSHVTGRCPAGCAPGHRGSKCKTECSDGTYGEDCQNTCGHCKDGKSCSPVTGYCLYGCAPGFVSDYCNKTCQDGYYGDGCLKECGECDEDKPCNKSDGTCQSGCDHGYKLPLCKQECDNGTYGKNCSNTCGHCLNSTACDTRNGTCPACRVGYVGPDCILQLGSWTPEDSDITPIIGGVAAGVVVLALIIVAAVLIRKRRSSNEPREEKAVMSNLHRQDEANPNLSTITESKPSVSESKENKKAAVEQDENGINKKARVEQDESKINKKAPVKQDESEINKKALVKPDESEINKMAPVRDSVTDEGSATDADYYGFITRKKELKVCQLWDYIYQKKKAGSMSFYQEFNLLTSGLLHPHEVAMLKENRPKNRYRGVCAYDHSRVPLEAEENESEYINASFINGTDRQRKFIASQGPTEAMRNDFWRMVWQQNSCRIVMLTNLMEMGTEKCLQYWPQAQDEEVTYGKITVQLQSVSEEPDLVIRCLRIKKEGEAWRPVTQYHYRAWPDKDVPDSTWSLVKFWLTAMDDVNDDRPTVVHCSAGVGRTGTFIALDNVYHEARSQGKINVLDTVTSIRGQRLNMVQTKEQFVFLHEAVADALLFGTHYIWSSQFEDVYRYLTEENQQRLKTQFRLIEESIEDKKRMIQETSVIEEVEYSNVFIQPKESSSNTTNDGNIPKIEEMEQMYTIGAVLLPNYEEENTFVVSKTPTDTTIAAFWSLISELNVKTVISLTDMSASKYATCSNLGAQLKEIEDKFQVGLTDGNGSDIHKEQILSYKGKNGPATVHQFTFKAWSEDEKVPKDPKSMLNFLEVVLDWQGRLNSSQPVFVHCSGGDVRSGLVCVLLSELERMKRHQGHTNPLQSVKLIKGRDEHVIPHVEQYKYIYDVILATFHREGDIYANC